MVRINSLLIATMGLLAMLSTMPSGNAAPMDINAVLMNSHAALLTGTINADYVELMLMNL